MPPLHNRLTDPFETTAAGPSTHKDPDVAPPEIAKARYLDRCWADVNHRNNRISVQCAESAATPIGLCEKHYRRYSND